MAAKAVFGIAKSEEQATRIVNALKEAGFSNMTFRCCCRTARARAISRMNITPRRRKAPLPAL